MEPTANQPANVVGNTDKHQVVELCISTALFIIMFMLAANVSVLVAARRSTDEACRLALLKAKRAAEDGQSRQEVMHAALAGVNTCGPGGFLVRHPEFVSFRDGHHDGKRALIVSTRALVRIPAPFLMPNAPFNQDGELSVARTLLLEVEPPAASKAEKRSTQKFQ